MRWWWNKTNKPTSETQTHQNTVAPAQPSVVENEFINNITFLYSLLGCDNQKKGYEDSLLNPDDSNLHQSVDILKNELKRSISKVTIFYEDFLTEIRYLIERQSTKDSPDQIKALEMKKTIAERHMDRIKLIEQGVDQATGECSGYLATYIKGFQTGLNERASSYILKKL